MAEAPASCPTYSLSRQELRILTELALKAPVPLGEGYSLTPLLKKVEGIVNSPYELVSDVPKQVLVEAVTSDNP